MKTKLLAVIFASLALVGCGGSNEAKVSAEVPAYWTEIARQNTDYNGRQIITYVDKDNHVIVVMHGSHSTSVTQIVNAKPMPNNETK